VRVGARGVAAATVVLVASPFPRAAAGAADGAPNPQSLLSPQGVLSADSLASLQESRLSALAAITDPAQPIAWQGRILDPSGSPTSADVVLYVRPDGSTLQTQSTSDSLIPVAETTSAADGSFTLNAVFDPSYSSFLAPNGSLTFMLIASTDGAMGLSTRSVWWNPATSTWDPQDPSQVADQDVGIITNPDIHMMATPVQSASSGAATPSATQSATHPPGNCIFWQGAPGPDTKAFIGASYLVNASKFTAYFDYLNTKTSTFQTGWSAGVTAVGASFSIAGTETTQSSNSQGGEHIVPPSAKYNTGRKHWITVHTTINQWRCWTSSTTPPASPGNWPTYITLEPGAWARDYAMDSVSVPKCNTAIAANQSKIGHGSWWRANGSSTSFSSSMSGSVSFNGQAIGFNFGVHVMNDFSNGLNVKYTYFNSASSNKDLCGVNGPVANGDTVVVGEAT
jgi:hypothetical protein